MGPRHSCIGGIVRATSADACPFRGDGCPGGPDTGSREAVFGQVLPGFVFRMRDELAANEQNKGDWSTWRPDRDDAFREVQDHMTKLYWALSSGDRDKISEHAADIANACMKIYELYGEPW